MKRITKALSVFTIVMLAIALMPVGSVFAAAPTTSGVAVTPDPAPLNGTATVSATITAVSGETVKAAFYSLNGAADVAMTGTFGTEIVNVTATFTPILLGDNEICVHGVNNLDEVETPAVCASFTVTDQTPPVVSAVKVTAVLMGASGTATITATISDVATGGSNIKSAAFTLGSSSGAMGQSMAPSIHPQKMS